MYYKTNTLGRENSQGKSDDCGQAGEILRLEGFEERSDFGARPILGTDEFAPDNAIAVNGIGFRPHIGIEQLGYGFRGVADGDQIDVMTGNEGRIRCGVVVNADGEDDQVRHVVVELDEGGQLLQARSALAPPEVDQDDLSTIVGEVDGVGAVAHREVRRRDVELSGV